MLTDLTKPAWMPTLRLPRSKRIILLLVGVWVVQALDLRFTLTAHHNGVLRELNPLGLWALQYGTAGTVVFKATLVVLCSAVLLHFRARRVTEHLLCLVVAAHIGLSLRWHEYHQIFASYGIDSTIRWQGEDFGARRQNASLSTLEGISSWEFPRERSGIKGDILASAR